MKSRKIFFTQQGLEDMQKQYDDLQEKRKVAVDDLSRARDMGDRSENAFYKSSRIKLSGIDRELRRLANIIKNAQIITPNANGVIDIGSQVTLENENGTVTYTIVGGFESDLSKGRISLHSPLGKALMGKKKGEKATIHVPAGIIYYIIKEVS